MNTKPIDSRSINGTQEVSSSPKTPSKENRSVITAFRKYREGESPQKSPKISPLQRSIMRLEKNNSENGDRFVDEILKLNHIILKNKENKYGLQTLIDDCESLCKKFNELMKFENFVIPPTVFEAYFLAIATIRIHLDKNQKNVSWISAEVLDAAKKISFENKSYTQALNGCLELLLKDSKIDFKDLDAFVEKMINNKVQIKFKFIQM